MTTREVLTRSFETELVADGDGRTIVGRCVPYGVRSTVRDRPDAPSYTELFERGAFARVCAAPNRVLLRFEHNQGLADTVGHAVELDDRPDGLWGRFRALTSGGADVALELVAAGVLTGLSVGFVPLTRAPLLSDGTVIRTRCHLDEVSLCREPAYAGPALAVRDGDPPAMVEPWRDLRPRRDEALEGRILKLLRPDEGAA